MFSLSILWLDDEVRHNMHLVSALNKSGIDVYTATSLIEARKIAETARGEIDLVVTDIMGLVSPNLSSTNSMGPVGVEISQYFRRRHPNTPIIACSAFSEAHLPEMNFSGSISEIPLFDHFVSKVELMNEPDVLVNLVHSAISAKFADRYELDATYVMKLLSNKQYEIVANSIDGDFLAGARSFTSYAEVSNAINDRLLNALYNNPELLMGVDDRRFEEICATILKRDGFRVHLTPKSGDGGYDLVALADHLHLPSFHLVECKRWDITKRKIGVPVLRHLQGAVSELNASGGLVMTTSMFTTPAFDYVSGPTVNMNLVDFFQLKEWIHRVTKN